MGAAVLGRQQLKQMSLPRQNMGSEKREPLKDLSKCGKSDRAMVAERIAGESGRAVAQITTD